MSPEDYRSQLKAVDLSDGVSEEEAILIAQNNLIDDGTDKFCALSKPSIGDSRFTVDGAGHPLAPCWEVRFNAILKMRLRGLEWFMVLIDKQTGQIKGSGWGPS